MVIIKGKLDEMAIRPVSSREDGLPFRIAIKSPDHQPPHAHIMDLKTGKKELGQFLIAKNSPRLPNDIKDYKQGITDDMRALISKWAGQPHRPFPGVTNWEALYLDWTRNEKF